MKFVEEDNVDNYLGSFSPIMKVVLLIKMDIVNMKVRIMNIIKVNKKLKLKTVKIQIRLLMI